VSRAPGFTLLEVMVAIVLTSLVVLLAYGAAQVSFDARARLDADLRGLQGPRALRALLQDALRNVRSLQRPGDPRFTLRDGRLSFVTAGGGPPFDPDYDWLLTIEPSAGGLELVAALVGRSPPAQVAVRVPGVTRWDVRVLGPGGSQWLAEWPAAMVVPRAVAIRFWHGSEPFGLPLQVALSPAQPLAAPEEEDAP
jgi:prepilin-type N-terminal cleavage/methylation domain-containing protein